ncbi:MAG: hypothetical protein IPK26_29725 [Planctomycetes bacterium]|nr:hypothetical protein [Planctomycetota bacterium]
MFEFAVFGILLAGGGTLAMLRPVVRRYPAVHEQLGPVYCVAPWLGLGAVAFGLYFLLRYSLWYLQVLPLLSTLLLIVLGVALLAEAGQANLPLAPALAAPIRRANQSLERVEVPLGGTCLLLGLYALWCVSQLI